MFAVCSAHFFQFVWLCVCLFLLSTIEPSVHWVILRCIVHKRLIGIRCNQVTNCAAHIQQLRKCAYFRVHVCVWYFCARVSPQPHIPSLQCRIDTNEHTFRFAWTVNQKHCSPSAVEHCNHSARCGQPANDKHKQSLPASTRESMPQSAH